MRMAVLAALCWSGAASAEIAVSANDGKQFRAGDAPLAGMPDTVSVIDLGRGGARVVGTVSAPASLIGPPASVTLSRDGRMAIVTGSQKLDGASPPKLIPDRAVSVIDLSRPAAPRVVQVLAAGLGAGGVAIAPDGRLALVANAGDDTVSVFRIENRRLVPAGAVALDPKSKPVMARFAPDGRTAWVVAQEANRLVRLNVEGAAVRRAGAEITPGQGPYSMALSPDGRTAYVTNVGGRVGAPPPAPGTPAGGTVSAVDLGTGAVTAEIATGVLPEGVNLSPSGRHLSVTVVNGSTAQPTSPAYHDHGLLKLFAVAGARLTPMGEARTGRWCQGAVWSDDERRILLQCADRKQIETYRFDGARLTPDPVATITLNGRPGAFATARSR